MPSPTDRARFAARVVSPAVVAMALMVLTTVEASGARPTRRHRR